MTAHAELERLSHGIFHRSVCVLHWVACVWCLLAQLEEDFGLATWEDSEQIPEEIGSVNRYLYGLEFALFAMVLGYGRSYPTTAYEQIFALGTMLLMGAFYAYALGCICGVIATMDPAGTEVNRASYCAGPCLDPTGPSLCVLTVPKHQGFDEGLRQGD